MSYCRNCGAEINDEADVCVQCGCLVNPPNNNGDALLDAAKILMIITCIAYPIMGFCVGLYVSFASTVIGILMGVFFASPTLWLTPMTVHLHKSIKNKQSVGKAFKMITLLLGNPPAGIILLCHH